MFAALLKKELLANLRNQRYVIALALTVTLLGVSVWSMERAHRAHLRDHADANLSREERARQPQTLWQFLRSGNTVEKKPAALAALARGLDGEMTRSLTYSGWDEVEAGQAKLFSPLFRLFAPPDFLYVINVVGSLLALLFIYDAVCGEKEQGTLRLVLACPVPRDHVLLAKWVGGVLSVGVPLALAALAMWIFLSSRPSFEGTVDLAVRFLLIFLAGLLYLSAFLTLGLLVSCLVARPATSLMLCLFLWMLLVLVVPNLMPMIARSLRPIPSEGKLAVEKRHKAQEVRDWVDKNLRSRIHDPDEYYQTQQRFVARAMEELDQFRRNRVREQIGLAQALARVSPSACFTYAASDLAGTGLSSFLDFQRYAVWYRPLFNQAMDRLMAEYRARARSARTRWYRTEFQPSDRHKLPRFRPPRAPFTVSLGAALFDLGLLAAFNTLFFLGAYAAFLRYDVR